MTAPTSTPRPDPTPGAVAWLVAVETWDCSSDHGAHTTTRTARWDGYTAADMAIHWAARAKTAGWDRRWVNGALVVTMPAIGKTITRTFHDSEPA